VGATAVVAVLAALGVVLLRPDEPSAAQESPAPGGRPSIAVLPFTNTSGTADQEYFSIGLTEDIITELSRYSELAVIAHFATADFQKQNADAELSEIAKTLRARYVLQGNVFRQGERIRINVRLSDAAEGRSLWGTTYERDLTVQDLFAIQDDLTQQVVSAIAGSYGALARAGLSAIRGKPPSELSSYDCVLRAYDYLQNHTTENHALARACLERVVEAEPEYAEALAWLGYIYAEEYHHRRNERPDEYDALERALELGLEAVRLDNASHVTHGNLGLTYYFRGDYERAVLESRRAYELAPNHAMWLAIIGLYHIQRENFEEGVPMVNRAIELFTPHPPGWVRMATFLDHYAHERYEQALAELRATDLGEDFRHPMFLAATFGQLGRTDDIPPVLAELRRLWPYPLGELRREMIERHAHSSGLTGHLMEGLQKAGADLSPP
jgi:adenylate cyclase